MKTFKLDRTAFSIKTFNEADNTTQFWRNKTSNERFEAAWYLICQAYNLDPSKQHKLDRTIFSFRKHA